jgi:8-oxo-dGTP diphosphatase
MENKRPNVGIGILILKEGKVLLGKRKNAHGAGQYCFPGGHLEYMESFEQCARREIEEECGLKVTNLRFNIVANERHPLDQKHVAHIGLVADWESGEVVVREPDKCESWDWYDMDDLPSPLFGMTALGIEGYKSGKNYFDAE